jgi:hypothetical protein
MNKLEETVTKRAQAQAEAELQPKIVQLSSVLEGLGLTDDDKVDIAFSMMGKKPTVDTIKSALKAKAIEVSSKKIEQVMYEDIIQRYDQLVGTGPNNASDAHKYRLKQAEELLNEVAK